MSDLMIRTHDFEEAKQGLKEFSEHTTTDLDLRKVDTSKGVGEWIFNAILGDGLGTGHKVTGAELNELTSQIQTHLIDINTMHKRIIKEFGQVYNALEALDKDYIQAILISIKATEETSKRIEVTQGQIKKIIDDQKKTLEVLEKFKQKLDKYDHLGDIDKMWNDFQKWHKEIVALSNAIDEATFATNANTSKIDSFEVAFKDADERIANFGKRMDVQIAYIESSFAFVSQLEETAHIHHIDEMWESIQNAHVSLTSISKELNSIRTTATKQQVDTEHLLAFVDKLSGYEHLQDIDEMWRKEKTHSDKLDDLSNQGNTTLELIQHAKDNIKELSKYQEQLCGIAHLYDVDELWASNEIHTNRLSELENQSHEMNEHIQEDKNLIDATIAELREKSDSSVRILTKKIKHAYLLAGGAAVLALIELVVILSKVI